MAIPSIKMVTLFISSSSSSSSQSSSSSNANEAMFHSSSPPPPPPQHGHHQSLYPAVRYSYATPAANGHDDLLYDYDANGCAFPPPPPPQLSSSPPNLSTLPPYHLHRSGSSHSLPVPDQHHRIPDHLNWPPFFSSTSPPPQHRHHSPLLSALSSSSPSSCSCEFADLSSGPMRRVFSTGDLQGTNGLQPSVENSNQDGGATGGRVGRYSAEERKERIERYRSKRNQRNFHRKITYACRKTLADSRPRVRGRFARNDEPETEAEADVETEAASISFDYYNYNVYEQMQSYADGGNGGSMLRQKQPAPFLAVASEDDEFSYYDELLLSNFTESFSMNLL